MTSPLILYGLLSLLGTFLQQLLLVSLSAHLRQCTPYPFWTSWSSHLCPTISGLLIRLYRHRRYFLSELFFQPKPTSATPLQDKPKMLYGAKSGPSEKLILTYRCFIQNQHSVSQVKPHKTSPLIPLITPSSSNVTKQHHHRSKHGQRWLNWATPKPKRQPIKSSRAWSNPVERTEKAHLFGCYHC